MRYQQYHTAKTLAEAVDLLHRDPQSRIIAGGTDLMVQLHRRAIQVQALVDISRIEELRLISRENGTVQIGSAVTYQELIDSPIIKESAPLLAEASRKVGAAQVQHMGTIGGNLANASPAGDILPALAALDADLRLFGAEGERILPLQEFITGVRKTVLKPGELITHVRFYGLPRSAGSAFVKFGLRQSQAISVVSAAAVLLASPRGTIEQAAVALGAVSPRPLRSARAEALLIGNCASQDLFSRAGEAAQDDVSPIKDLRGGEDFRRHLVKVLVRQVLEKAWGAVRVEEGAAP